MSIFSKLFKRSEKSAGAALDNNIGDPIDNLASAITFTSAECAAEIKQYVAKDRWVPVLFEYIYFYLHLMNRLAFKFGDERRVIIFDEVSAGIRRHLLRAAGSVGAAELLDDAVVRRTFATFVDSFDDREAMYAKCKVVFSAVPLDRNALLSKLLFQVMEARGTPLDSVFDEFTPGEIESFAHLKYFTDGLTPSDIEVFAGLKYQEMDLEDLVKAAGRAV